MVGLRGHNGDRHRRGLIQRYLELTDHRSEYQGRLGQGELRADADARAGTERQVGKAWRRWRARHEACGLESIRIAPEPAMPTEHPRGDHEYRSTRNLDLTDPVRADCLAHDGECRRIKAQRFADHRAGTNQAWQRIHRSFRHDVELPNLI